MSFLRKLFGADSSAGSSGDPEELLPEERRFLEIVRPMGLDWTTPRSEFERRHGVTTVHEFLKVIELPPATIFTKEPLAFRINHEPRFADLPPEYLTAYFNPHRDARKNFSDAKEQIAAKLGEGERRDVSNLLHHRWKFGMFEVALRAWPSDVQPHYLTKMDVTYFRNPELVEAATIEISSTIAKIFPYKELQWIADLHHGKNVPAARKILKIPVNHNSFGIRYDIVRSRRNPGALKDVITDGSVIAWKTEMPGKIGVTYRETSLIFDMKPDGALILTRIRAARGPGGSEISLEESPSTDPKIAWANRQAIICHDEMPGLDELARQLCAFWNLEMRTETTDAD